MSADWGVGHGAAQIQGSVNPYPGQLPKPETRGPSITGSVECFDNVIKRLHESLVSLERIADTLAGPRPEKVVDAPQPERPTLVANLYQRYEALAMIADRIQYALDAIHKSL